MLNRKYILDPIALKPLESCPLAAAANMAASWVLASGTETTVRFAQPVYPTPIVFIGSPTPIAGIPRLAVSQVTSDSFRVQTFGVVCGGRLATLKLSRTHDFRHDNHPTTLNISLLSIGIFRC